MVFCVLDGKSVVAVLCFHLEVQHSFLFCSTGWAFQMFLCVCCNTNYSLFTVITMALHKLLIYKAEITFCSFLSASCVCTLYKSTFLKRSPPNFAHVSPLVCRRSLGMCWPTIFYLFGLFSRERVPHSVQKTAVCSTFYSPPTPNLISVIPERVRVTSRAWSLPNDYTDLPIHTVTWVCASLARVFAWELILEGSPRVSSSLPTHVCVCVCLLPRG
jgi:hypothetical protein